MKTTIQKLILPLVFSLTLVGLMGFMGEMKAMTSSVSDIEAFLVSDTTAAIRWKSEITERTNAIIEYGTSPGNYNQTGPQGDVCSSGYYYQGGDAWKLISGLNPGTTYYYRVKITNQAGNVYYSEEKYFITRYQKSEITSITHTSGGIGQSFSIKGMGFGKAPEQDKAEAGIFLGNYESQSAVVCSGGNAEIAMWTDSTITFYIGNPQYCLVHGIQTGPHCPFPFGSGICDPNPGISSIRLFRKQYSGPCYVAPRGVTLLNLDGPKFTILTKEKSPHVISISPQSGPLGTLVTIKGRNFRNDCSVRPWCNLGVTFGKVGVGNQVPSDDFIKWTDTEIQVKVPRGATEAPIKIRYYYDPDGVDPGPADAYEIYGPTFTIPDFRKLPDLTIKGISIKEIPTFLEIESPRVGQEFQLIVNVENIGDKVSEGGVDVILSLTDGKGLKKEETIGGMTPTKGGTAPYTVPYLMIFYLKYDKAGTYHFRAEADSLNRVEESNENNNVFEKRIVIQEEEICPTSYDPVCGMDNKTYSNDCVARKAGVEIKHKRKCFEVVGVDPGVSTFITKLHSVFADGEMFTNLIVTVKDSQGKPLAEKKVEVISDRNQVGVAVDEIETLIDTTTKEGKAIFTVSSQKPGFAIFTAMVEGIELAQKPKVHFKLRDIGKEEEFIKKWQGFEGRLPTSGEIKVIVYNIGRDIEVEREFIKSFTKTYPRLPSHKEIIAGVYGPAGLFKRQLEAPVTEWTPPASYKYITGPSKMKLYKNIITEPGAIKKWGIPK